MERTFTLIFLCAAAEGELQHILISTPQNWSDAQAYCRLHYIDLSYVASQSDQLKLQEAAGGNSSEGWIGLHHSPDNNNAWIWSGGENVTYQNWGKNQPDNGGGEENFVHLFENGEWNDRKGSYLLPFYCMSIPIVDLKMSWEEAQEYCRANQSNLSNLLSDFDLLRAQKAIQLEYVTDPVWIGLRYLNDQWLWVSGDPLVYNAWPQEDQDQLCPVIKRCGALTKRERWKNWDCQDRLNFICI